MAGTSNSGSGVAGTSASGNGLTGASTSGNGVFGTTESQTQYGVSGENNSAYPCTAIQGISANGHGVRGVNQKGSGNSPNGGCGVWGDSDQGYGVYGSSKSGIAGGFAGNVSVTGNLTANDVFLSGADCAEEFDAAAGMEPGTVAVLDADGALCACTLAYDKRVAGVISGAGEFRPAIVLDRRQSARQRAPIALVGKVYCKVDANHAPIEVGDLLTSSPTLGHAMRAADPGRSFGTVIGKALRPLKNGRGLLPILVTLQ